MLNQAEAILVHHSYTPRDLEADRSEQSFNNNHRGRGFPAAQFNGKTWYIGYHYVIYGNGEIRQYRSHDEVGAHTKEDRMNFRSIGICLVGNFDEEDPSDAQLESLRTLVGRLRLELGVSNEAIYPHRHFATYKSCYGTRLPDNPNELLHEHWSEPAMDWAREHRIINHRHDPNAQVTWGEMMVAFQRLADRLVDWDRE